MIGMPSTNAWGHQQPVERVFVVKRQADHLGRVRGMIGKT